MNRAAALSPDGVYRYDLRRVWGAGPGVVWVMLNPSTADALDDDPTIRRCIGFSQRQGFGRLVVVNLFALRSTDPAALLTHPDPVGPENAAVIEQHIQATPHVIVAWGATKKPQGPPLGDIARRHGRPLACLGKTKDGSPRHPLYVKGTQPFEVWP